MRTYAEAAAKEHARSNILTEIMFASALERAKELDAEFAKTGKIVGPLHGVPVSLKDQIDVQGVDTTMGFTHKQRQPMPEDATLTRIIRQVRARSDFARGTLSRVLIMSGFCIRPAAFPSSRVRSRRPCSRSSAARRCSASPRIRTTLVAPPEDRRAAKVLFLEATHPSSASEATCASCSD